MATDWHLSPLDLMKRHSETVFMLIPSGLAPSPLPPTTFSCKTLTKMGFEAESGARLLFDPVRSKTLPTKDLVLGQH